MAEEHVLKFGKHKGQTLSAVPTEYLLWLADVDTRVNDVANEMLHTRDSYLGDADLLPNSNPARNSEWWAAFHESVDKASYMWCHRHAIEQMRKLTHVSLFPSAQLCVWMTHRDAVVSAKALLQHRRLCRKCGKRLVPIGDARANGAPHPDWEARGLHKKCWLATIREEDAGVVPDDTP